MALPTADISMLSSLHRRLASAADDLARIARELGQCSSPEPPPPVLPYSGVAPVNPDLVRMSDELLARWCRQLDRGLRDAIAVRRAFGPISPAEVPEIAEVSAALSPDASRQRR